MAPSVPAAAVVGEGLLTVVGGHFGTSAFRPRFSHIPQAKRWAILRSY